MRFPLLIVAFVILAEVAHGAELSRDQRLIVACYRLDVDGVVGALRDGANVNSCFGGGDVNLLQDRWSLGWPIAAKKWTPLIALASASEYPDPPRVIKNAVADLERARAQKDKIPPEQIEKRQHAAVTIALILLSHNADIDADDGFGATPLYVSIDDKKLELAKLFLRFNAKVNTKTGIYIDGAGSITPLHQAYWSAELTKLLLEKGADASAKDSEGKTPADWTRMSDDPSVARLYHSR